jgi:16S rRNA (cytidine1402-2'-O)-methyltransferase
MVLARELTKKFEEAIRGRISEVIAELEMRAVKGEMTLMITGYERPDEE